MKKLLVIVLLISASIFAQDVEIPKVDKYATDMTNTLSSSQLSKLNSALRSFEDRTSNQIVFLMIPTLDDYPISMYTYEVADKNKIGTEKNDNGVLLFVAKQDRKMRIEVGYGLEGALPDALASSIIRNEIAPYFKRDNYYQGVVAGLNSIIAATQGEYQNNRKRRKKDDDGGFPFVYLLFIILGPLLFGRGGRGLGGLILLSSLGGGSRGGGFGGGGGFSGGGFSGGGGSFGGGGASGGW